MRAFFEAHGFLEVETPGLVAAPGQEPFLDPLAVAGEGWLITSPEYHMKRLLADGAGRIVQICRCYRGGESGPHHRTEFTMIEWYRPGEGVERIIDDVEHLARHVASALGNREGVDLTAPWPRLSVDEAFGRWAGVDLSAAPDAVSLRSAARRAGCHSIDQGDDWDTIFHKLLVERVEPGLASMGRGVHLRDYPASLAALARLHPARPERALRFESYAAGLELANGFDELTDARVQRRRFREERELRRRERRALLPLDEAFLRDLRRMPPAAGVALGFDRLLMLATGTRCIDDVVAF